MRDLRFALRQLYRHPGYAVACVLTLALALGVNTAVFSLLDGFLLRPLPYAQSNRVGELIYHVEGVSSRTGQAFSEEDDSMDGTVWQDALARLTAVDLASGGGSNGVNLQSGSAVLYVRDARVSANYFHVLGQPLYRGRELNADEDRAGGPEAAVISYGLWQSAFGADPNVLGRTIDLKGTPFTVVGVLPGDARTPSQADVFTPLRPSPSGGECGGENCGILMRLKPGATWAQANAELALMPRPRYINPADHQWFYVEPLQRYLGADERPLLEGLMLAVGLILLIGCANLAALTLVRFARRQSELATRVALGASRVQLLRQLWLEGLVVAAAGAVAALLVAAIVLAAVRGLLTRDLMPMMGIGFDLRVLAFTALAAIGASLLFAALPVLTLRGLDLRSAIVAGSQSVVRGAGRTRQWLIGGEVALTVVLLAGAGLLVRTLVHLETLPAHFDPTNVITAKASLADPRFSDPATLNTLLTQSLANMRRIPGVEAAAAGLSAPYERGLNWPIRIEDGPEAGAGPGSSLTWVTLDYFTALRIPLLAGRYFGDDDGVGTLPVAVVNQAFAQQFFRNPAPLGLHFKLQDVSYTIVGVVANVAKQPGMSGDAPLAHEPVFYIPAAQTPKGVLSGGSLWFQPSWIVRSRAPVAGLTKAMQQALFAADPSLPFSGFYSESDLLAQQLQMQRIEVTLLGVLAGLALLLSALGLYALVSNLVVQRTRDLAIRMALGSTPARAIAHVSSSGLIAAVAGLAAGYVLSLLALPALKSQIYGVGELDPLTLVAVAVILGGVACVASLVPALRVARIDPASALRAE